MRRFSLAIGAASVLAAAALPATASAADIQIGQSTSAIAAPTCPSGTTAATCYILLTEETAVQTVSNGSANPYQVTQPGNLYSFDLGISSAAKPYITGTTLNPGLNTKYGGPPEVELTVLRPVGTGKVPRYEVAAESPAENLTNYQGEVVQFGLPETLPVVKGEIVALTSPTWAPVISIDLSQTGYSYDQSRSGNCANNGKLPAYYNPQDALGQITSYGCSFPGNQVQYYASEVTTPNVAASIRASRVHHRAFVRVIKRG